MSALLFFLQTNGLVSDVIVCSVFQKEHSSEKILQSPKFFTEVVLAMSSLVHYDSFCHLKLPRLLLM